MSARYQTQNDIKRMWRNRVIAACVAMIITNPYSLLIKTTIDRSQIMPMSVKLVLMVFIGFFVFINSEVPLMILDYRSREPVEFPDGIKESWGPMIVTYDGPHITSNYYRSVVKVMASENENAAIPRI